MRLSELAKVGAEVIDLQALKAAGVVPASTDKAKVIASGEISQAVQVKGIGVTRGARKAIEAAGGKVED